MIHHVIRLSLLAPLLAVAAFAGSGAANAAAVEKAVDYKISGKTYRGYAYYDDAVGKPLPVVILIPNWLGTTPENREQARELAGRDYLVFVADMYGRDQQPQDQNAAAKLVAGLYGDRGLLRQRAKAAKDAALQRVSSGELPGDSGKVAAIGFCFGGATALELARSGEPLAATVSIHGNLALDAPAQNRPLQTRVLALHGDADPFVPAAQLDAFTAEMRASGVDWALVRFGGAVHSFTDKHANTPGKAMYEPKAARRAFAMLRDFLNEAFAGSP